MRIYSIRILAIFAWTAIFFVGAYLIATFVELLFRVADGVT